jgi:hypothetical protein
VAKLLDNIWLKVIALFVGLLLWFHVVTEKNYNHRVQLPITEIVLGEDLVLADTPPDSITVIVSASGKQLLRRKWRARGVKIHAARQTVGRHTLNLTTANTSLSSPGNQVSLLEVVSPTSITLRVDQRAEKTVRVLPDIRAIPDDGFVVSAVSDPEPSEVTVIGARSRVQQITSISTEHKELTGLRNNLTLALPLAAPRGYGLMLQPDSVTVRIEIVAVKTRVFENIPIVVYNVPPAETVSTEPPVVRIELTGPPEEVDALHHNALIASADFRQTDSLGLAAIKIDCPASFKVRGSSADSVKIIVQ